MEFGEPPPKPNDLPSMHDLVMEDMAARKDFGFKKYQALLQPFNGRDPLKDLYEELIDALVYVRQALYERDNPAAKPNEGEPAATWCHCNNSREGHEYGTGMRCGPAHAKATAANCYCGGPEEIYPHPFGTRRHCREQVASDKQAPPR